MVWQYEKYIQEAHRQLENTLYYTELHTNPLHHMKEELTALLNRARDGGWINIYEHCFLSCEHPGLATFYITQGSQRTEGQSSR